MVAQAYYPSIWEVEAKGSQTQEQTGLHSKTLSENANNKTKNKTTKITKQARLIVFFFFLKEERHR
jgi:hypothetical protein